MNVRKVVAGSVLAAGLGVAGVFGAGTASAAPGISYSDGGANDFGMGDNTATGAQAKASEGNQALAVSLFGPSVADASGKGGSGNIAIAGSGSAATVKNGSGNIVVANTFSSSSVKNGDDNVLIGALGSDVNVENTQRQHRRRVRQRHQYPEQHRGEQPADRRGGVWNVGGRGPERQGLGQRTLRRGLIKPPTPGTPARGLVWLGNHPKI